jgi:hypothetical protein
MLKMLKRVTPLLFLFGCFFQAEEKKPEMVKTTLQIRTNEETNQGTPFYAVIKSIDYAQFLLDDYKKIATEAMNGKDDPAKLNAVCFVPGETKTIEVENKDNKPVAIYFIFTHPGEEWKYLTDESEGHQVKILLGENQIKSVRAF